MDLQSLCSTDETRAHLCRPFAVTIDGERWIAATNGHGLFARCSDEETPPHPQADTERLAKPTRDIPGILAILPSVDVSLADLRAWAGDPTIVEPAQPCAKCGGTPSPKCRNCDGSGECECHCGDTHDCGECGGNGKLVCGACGGADELAPREIIRPGAIGCAVVNRALLARYLAPATGERCRVATADRYDPVRVYGGGWRVALMPVRLDAEGEPFPLPGEPT